MAVNWPDTLPQAWRQEGYQEVLPEVAVRTNMDAGPAKSRRRFICQVTPIKSKLVLTPAEKGYLETFFNTTTAGGSLSFTFPHDGSDTLRFTKPPVLSPHGGVFWMADLDLEKLP
jgi:hypothetical protein